MAGDSATGDFHTHFKHLFFLDLDHACTPSPAHPHSLCARLPFPVPPRPLSHAAKAQSVPIWEGVLVSACPGRREEAGLPFACSAHPTACGARLLQLSRDALHPPHVHLWGRWVQERDSRVTRLRGFYRRVWHRSALAAQPRGVRGAGARAAAAAAAGRERRMGCRRGSCRRGALRALRGDGRRGRAGGGWWRGLESGGGESGCPAPTARERGAPSPRPLGRHPCHLRPRHLDEGLARWLWRRSTQTLKKTEGDLGPGPSRDPSESCQRVTSGAWRTPTCCTQRRALEAGRSLALSLSKERTPLGTQFQQLV